MAIITTDYGLTKPPPGCSIDYGHTINRGLVGYWMFNEKGGLRLNDCFNNNYGTLTSTTWTGSPQGGALKFDGSTSYGLFTNEANFDQVNYLSVSTWLYKASATANVVALAKSNSGAVAGNGWILDYAGFTAGQIEFAVIGSPHYLFGGAAINTNQWYHVVGIFNATLSGNAKVSMYINGVPRTLTYNNNAGNVPSTIGLNDTNISIGSYANTNNKWDGNIDQTRIYNRIITRAEAVQLYSQPNIGLLQPQYYIPSQHQHNYKY